MNEAERLIREQVLGKLRLLGDVPKPAELAVDHSSAVAPEHLAPRTSSDIDRVLESLRTQRQEERNQLEALVAVNPRLPNETVTPHDLGSTRESLWALAATAPMMPSLVLPRIQLKSGSLPPPFVGIHPRVADIFGLANRYGGYILIGVHYGRKKSFVFTDCALSPESELIEKITAQASELGFPAAAINVRCSRFNDSRVLIFDVPKLRRPLPVVVDRDPYLVFVRGSTVSMLPIEGMVEGARVACAVTHGEAIKARGLLRLLVERGLKNAPPVVKLKPEPPAPPVAPRLKKPEQPRKPEQPKKPTPLPTPLPEASLTTVERLTWEVLPQAELEFQWLSTLKEENPGAGRAEVSESLDRLRLLRSMRPRREYVGKQLGKRPYFVFEFNRIVVAESPTYGNALYYLRTRGEEWKWVFGLSKKDARKEGAVRLIHSENYEERVRDVIEGRVP